MTSTGVPSLEARADPAPAAACPDPAAEDAPRWLVVPVRAAAVVVVVPVRAAWELARIAGRYVLDPLWRGLARAWRGFVSVLVALLLAVAVRPLRATFSALRWALAGLVRAVSAAGRRLAVATRVVVRALAWVLRPVGLGLVATWRVLGWLAGCLWRITAVPAGRALAWLWRATGLALAWLWRRGGLPILRGGGSHCGCSGSGSGRRRAGLRPPWSRP